MRRRSGITHTSYHSTRASPRGGQGHLLGNGRVRQGQGVWIVTIVTGLGDSDSDCSVNTCGCHIGTVD